MTEDAITGDFYMTTKEKLYVALGIVLVGLAAYLWVTQVWL
jgi:hypothetical protein